MPYFRHEMAGPIAAGDQWNATLHTNSTAAIDAVHTAFNTFVSSFLGVVRTFWPINTICSSTETFQLDPSTGKNVAVLTTAVSFAGTDAGQAVSPSTTLTVGLRTTLPTRAGRGRFYLPGLSAGHMQTTGIWNQAACTAIADEAGTALGVLNGVAVVVVYHRATKTGTNVNRITVGTTPNVQRRRVNKILNNYESAPVS